jgi:hypothetical protein
MSQYIIFRIIGWVLISYCVMNTSYKILTIQSEESNLTSAGLFLVIIMNVTTIWFIYTAMQI